MVPSLWVIYDSLDWTNVVCEHFLNGNEAVIQGNKRRHARGGRKGDTHVAPWRQERRHARVTVAEGKETLEAMQISMAIMTTLW